jgi:hypothetical protein
MAANLNFTKDQLDHLTNLIIKKLHGNIKLSPETIAKISKEIDTKPIVEAVINILPIPKDGINGAKGEDGKDATVSDEIISTISVEVLKKVSELFTQPENGIDGRQGERGPQGLPGRDGQPGAQGAVGFRGPQGDKGLKGDKGDTGPQGETGPKGEKGDQGDRGTDGLNGVITDDDIQKVVNLLDLSNHVTKEGLDLIIKKLLQDIALGKVELPVQELGGGLSGPGLINEINKVLGSDSWKGGCFGTMLEHSDPATSTINFATASVFVPWVSASAGNLSSYITFESNAGGDRLVVGPGGAGSYSVDLSVSFSGSNNIQVEGAVFINNVEQEVIRPHRKLSSSGDLGSMSAGNMVSLSSGDYIDVRFNSNTSSTSINIFYCSLRIVRV